jgi:hypothetical protein
MAFEVRGSAQRARRLEEPHMSSGPKVASSTLSNRARLQSLTSAESQSTTSVLECFGDLEEVFHRFWRVQVIVLKDFGVVP